MNTNRIFYLTIFCLWLTTFIATAQTSNYHHLPEVQPQTVGLSPAHLTKIDDLCQEYLDKGWLPGGTILIARQGKVAYFKSWGYSNKDTKTPYRNDDIYRIASMTKGITTTAILQLVEQGKLRLDDPIAWYIPAFKQSKVIDTFNPKDTSFTTIAANKQISIRHLLTHTSGIPYPFSDQQLGAIYTKHKVNNFGLSHPTATTKEMVQQIAAQPLVHQPGEKYTYGHNTDVLGYLVEVITGQTLGEYCRANIFEPLQLNDTYFYLPKDRADRLIPVYNEDRKKGIVMPDQTMLNYPLLGRKDHFAGGGGLSSTAADYAVFCQMLLNGGHYNQQRILGRKTVDLIQTDQLAYMGISPANPRNGSSFGLGFSLRTAKADAHSIGSEGTFGWGGAFNTKYWIDPKEEMVFVGMTQIIPTLHGEFWDKLYSIIYASLEDEASMAPPAKMDIAGDWSYKVSNTPQGNIGGNMILSKKGTSFSGYMETAGQKADLQDIRFQDSKLSFKLDYGGTVVQVNAIMESDVLKGNCSAEGADFPFVATRK